MKTVALARHAMATRFEILLHGENEVALRAAGEEALDEIERLESQLSLYRPTSEISHLNARAGLESVRVSAEIFRLLDAARRLHTETEGAFDVTVAPLVRCWGFMGGSGELPDPAAVAGARAAVGMQHVELNEADFSVRFTRPGVMLDLGAIGKGYAIEKAVELLVEAGVTTALLHGGTSTIHAIGSPPGAACWQVAIDDPRPRESDNDEPAGGESTPKPLAVASLRDQALSVSAVWGKSFTKDGRTYGHVIDPRSGEPVEGALLAAVALPSAMETDALSTALLTLGLDGHERIHELRPRIRSLLLARDGDGPPIVENKGF